MPRLCPRHGTRQGRAPGAMLGRRASRLAPPFTHAPRGTRIYPRPRGTQYSHAITHTQNSPAHYPARALPRHCPSRLATRKPGDRSTIPPVATKSDGNPSIERKTDSACFHRLFFFFGRKNDPRRTAQHAIPGSGFRRNATFNDARIRKLCFYANNLKKGNARFFATKRLIAVGIADYLAKLVDIEQLAHPMQGTALAENNLAILKNLGYPDRIDLPKRLGADGACSGVNESIVCGNFVAAKRLERVGRKVDVNRIGLFDLTGRHHENTIVQSDSSTQNTRCRIVRKLTFRLPFDNHDFRHLAANKIVGFKRRADFRKFVYLGGFPKNRFFSARIASAFCRSKIVNRQDSEEARIPVARSVQGSISRQIPASNGNHPVSHEPRQKP